MDDSPQHTNNLKGLGLTFKGEELKIVYVRLSEMYKFMAVLNLPESTGLHQVSTLPNTLVPREVLPGKLISLIHFGEDKGGR